MINKGTASAQNVFVRCLQSTICAKEACVRTNIAGFSRTVSTS
jgi:hypothetical protein